MRKSEGGWSKQQLDTGVSVYLALLIVMPSLRTLITLYILLLIYVIKPSSQSGTVAYGSLTYPWLAWPSVLK